MTKFFATTGVSHSLEEIIKNASERLVLISPYLKVNDRLKELLEDKDRMKIDVRVIYGKSELQPEESDWLDSMASIRTSFCKNLHAKCYLNENEALVTSMNLYEFSQVNNYEMGLLISRMEEPELYREIHSEATRIVRASEERRIKASSVETSEDSNKGSLHERRPAQSPDTSAVPKRAFCIRCGTTVPVKRRIRPYCGSCYRSWDQYKNRTFEEKRCHTCGKEHASTLVKPLCSTCYGKYKDRFEFAGP